MDIVQTIILLVSAIAAAYAVVQHRRLTKKTSTLQVILSDTSDSRIVEASSNVYKMITSNKNFYEVLIKQSTEDKTEVESLKIILNRYEFYATGINKGILDGDLLKTLYYSNFMVFWKHAKPCIMELRKEKDCPTLFQEFEKVMSNWKKHPLKTY
ncbi:MAG: DUF4760 domain-containing protein [Succinivibrio sp.]|nr:DUF4760 domain-containing protein [Succinivibrio sp.]MDY4993149.1 DUF4760 domain-containing protein [Succinivibrio sp.]